MSTARRGGTAGGRSPPAAPPEPARRGHAARARLTQIMNLLHLAPDIQEAILFLPTVETGRTQLSERDLRPVAAEPDWQKQRRMWASVRG